ncbi:LysM peptidoglycan-binding domain-containing protein [Peribacillus frigoritolerans]|uniref:LysM peptidoglycan-binding domain-containing protein n=1 Tax=Peribacillus frigoritolerans TaxID=450367 RepID=UPI00207ABE31|nr:LysM peptidoglycan-binding domain-containing protein [Peribacillus frigoritolerans]USK73631.1 LysM peptidoglycan-binding domain-containing protein [Peribacillus frigoritolerans]
MSQENESYLRFSLEESVWFQKGQEVAELYSISLDPNVSIQESDQYVFIRGSLDLSGEYRDSQNGEEEEFSQTFLPKAVQKVERHPNGLNEFTHRFPVDITIPNNRIASLDEVDVSIQSFDYAMPEHNCLKLQADLLITGIYNDSYVEERFDTEQEVGETEDQEETDGENESYIPYAAAVPPIPDFQPVFRDEEEDELYAPFSAESKRVSEANEEEEEEPIYLSDQHNAPVFEIPVSPYPEEEEWETEVHRQEEAEAVEEDVMGDPSDSEKVPFMGEAKLEEEPSRHDPMEFPSVTFIEEVEEEPSQATNHQSSPVSNLETEDVIRQEDDAVTAGPILNENVKVEQEEESNSSISDLFKKRERPAPPAKEGKNFKGRKQAAERDEKETADHDEKQLSIMDLFGRKQEEELVRMKVCIVQQGETLDDLAQRYDVTVQSILFSNELESNQNVHEGQVIYIPKAVAYKN